MDDEGSVADVPWATGKQQDAMTAARRIAGVAWGQRDQIRQQQVRIINATAFSRAIPAAFDRRGRRRTDDGN